MIKLGKLNIFSPNVSDLLLTKSLINAFLEAKKGILLYYKKKITFYTLPFCDKVTDESMRNLVMNNPQEHCAKSCVT